MPRPEYMNPYGQNRNPAYSQNAGPNMGALGRTPLLQDPIANADPEMLAMLEAIMSATMGGNGQRRVPPEMQAFGRVNEDPRRGNPYSQYGFKYPAVETGYRDNSQPGFSQRTPPRGRNPYSDPGFSQGSERDFPAYIRGMQGMREFEPDLAPYSYVRSRRAPSKRWRRRR